MTGTPTAITTHILANKNLRSTSGLLMPDTNPEMSDIQVALDRLRKELTDHNFEIRWGMWFSLVVLCLILWRVW